MPDSFRKVSKDLTAKYTATINDKLIPQYKKMADFLNKEYLLHRTTSGIGSLPLEKDYAAYVKQWTTTDMTPEAIHELGLKEVARFQLKWKSKTQVV
jgi:uncharacterized protein (DUF885 family)